MNPPTASSQSEPARAHPHLTLGQAAQLMPGRPSAHAMWRWCRRGIKARSGVRVRLEHIRLGGRILTTAQWVEAFGHALAAADTAYFDAREEAGKALPPRDDARYGPPTRKRRQRRAPAGEFKNTTDLRALDAELRKEGL